MIKKIQISHLTARPRPPSATIQLHSTFFTWPEEQNGKKKYVLTARYKKKPYFSPIIPITRKEIRNFLRFHKVQAASAVKISPFVVKNMIIVNKT
jgi:hypothetical protein